jgi:hypothetical protein
MTGSSGNRKSKIFYRLTMTEQFVCQTVRGAARRKNQPESGLKTGPRNDRFFL